MKLIFLGVIIFLAGCLPNKGASQFLGVKCDGKSTGEICSQTARAILFDNSFYEVAGPTGTYQLNGKSYPVFFRNRDSAKSPCNSDTFENCIVSALRYNESSVELIVMLREPLEDEPSNDAKSLLQALTKSLEGQFGRDSVRMLGRSFKLNGVDL